MLYKTDYTLHKRTIMDTSQTLFLMYITDGYSFRNTIGIMKSESEYVTMIVSPKAIEISFLNSSKCAVHEIKLLPHEFARYVYNICDAEGKLLPEYPITFETTEMFNTTKSIGRRDGIRLYWMAGDNKLSVQPIKMSTKDPGRAGALFVKLHNKEYFKYDTGDHNPDPNVRVSAKEFADLCSQANTIKCTSLDIIGQANAVIFKSIAANNTVASVNRFVSQVGVPETSRSIANMDEIDNMLETLRVTETPAPQPTTGLSLNVVKSEDYMTVRVPIATVKALSKIHNISAPGTLLRFYFGERKPTKIETPIGTYGSYTISLRNSRA